MRPNIVVGGRRRLSQPLLVAMAVTAVVLSTPILYGLARDASWRPPGTLETEIQRLQADRDRLSRELRQQQASNEQLKQEVADLGRGREIDRQAWTEIQKSLSDEQQEVVSLREQLAFYRGVVSPQALRSGLHVNELRISRGATPDTYHFDLVLVQAARQDRRATGHAELRFIGRDQTAQRSISLTDLGPGKRGPLTFAFRRFQEFDGEFQFPRGFRPQRVIVTLMPDRGDSPHVAEEFEWSKIRDKSLAERHG